MLDEGKNNFISAVYLEENAAGVCFGDISTGEVFVTEFSGEGAVCHVVNELGRFSPREAVLSAGAMANAELAAFLREQLSCRCESGKEENFQEGEARCLASKQFSEDKMEELCFPAGSRPCGRRPSFLPL
jgi:DNA mismatch repair protein MutS